MRIDGINRIEAKTKKIVLDKTNLDMFVTLANRRDIRHGRVNTLVRILEAGQHFETPIVTSVRNSQERLLDGNHRVLAIEKYLKKNPDRKVEIWIFYYEGLNEEQEREKYTQWNLGTKQNTNDFIKQYWSTIPIVKMFEKSSPHPIGYCWNGKIEFKTLVSAYLTKDSKEYEGGYGGSSLEFVYASQKLGESDCKVICAFLKDFMFAFGVPDKKNMHYKQCNLWALFRIWLDNINTHNYDQLRKALTQVRGKERIVYWSTQGGSRANTTQCRIDLLKIINAHRTKNLFA